VIEGQESSMFKFAASQGETTYDQWRRFRYMLKSVDPSVDLDGAAARTASRSLLDANGRRFELGGFLTVSRLGVSPALAATQSARWAMSVPLPDMTTRRAHPPAFDDRFVQ
jgi:hypothetical protein